MKILLSGAIVLALWMGAGTYWYTCKIKCLCGESSAATTLADALPELTKPPVPDKVEAAKWMVMEDGSPRFSFAGMPMLQKNASDVSLPEAVTGITDSIYNHLLAYPDKFATITGRYEAGEDYAGEFANLGEARADFFRQLLVDAGVNPDRILIAGEEATMGFNDDGSYPGGIAVDLATMDAEVAEVVDEGIANRTLYADFGAIKFQPDPTLANYAAEVKAYLEKHPDQMIHITGHTDNVGTAEVNWKFGKWRASKVRTYFVSEGIEKKRINVDTKGMEDPIASNDTEEGRAQNRRIEVHIK